MRELENFIGHALRRAEGKLTEAARLAGMDDKTFSEKMKHLGVTLEPNQTYPSNGLRLRNKSPQFGRFRFIPSFDNRFYFKNPLVYQAILSRKSFDPYAHPHGTHIDL